MNVALVVRPDGTVTELPPSTGSHVGLAAIRTAIGCHLVDCVALNDGIDMWIDDEGLHTQPLNPAATALARRHGLTHQPYHGPVVLCGVTAEGDSVPLTPDQAAALRTDLEAAARL